jgi:predicted HTH transcriptional regulator
MNLTPEQRDQVAAELKRIGADLHLTEEQKSKLQGFLTEARGKIAEYHQANPNATRADIVKEVAAHRDQLRQRVVNFLNPEQLKTWDSEIGKAKAFLGEHMTA